MRRIFLLIGICAVSITALTGCGNPLKRPSENVFPGSQEYEARVKELKITPQQAYTIAREAAQTDGKLQFLSRRPTVIAKRTYVFSMPQPTGASLNGYHVDGNKGTVKFMTTKRVVSPK